MAQHYTLTSFLRQASNQLLADYFQAKGIDLGVNLKSLKHRKIEPVAAAIEALPDDAQADVNRDFQNVVTLADAGGWHQIVHEAQYQGVNVAAGWGAQKSVLDRTFWTFLNFPIVFEGATQFAVPYLAGRYWKRGLPVHGALVGDPGCKVGDLESALSTYFRREEGRGKSCKVEYHHRGAIHQFHAFPEDFPAAPLAWSKIGLEPHPYRPAFEVVFVFHQDQGTLDLYFQGRRQTIERLWQIFASTVLGIDNLTKPDKPSYALHQLKLGKLDFVRPPDSPIIDVRIRKLVFEIIGHPATKVTVETDVRNDRNAIHDAVRRTFASEPTATGHFMLSQSRVISVGVRALIDSRDGKRPRVHNFDLSEKSCSLKYEGADLLLRQMLIDSGIDLTGKAPDAGHGPPRQAA